MKESKTNKKKVLSEREAVVTFIVETEQKREREFRASIDRQLASCSAGKRVILNCK